jgi:lipopolysaccharide assembly protein A
MNVENQDQPRRPGISYQLLVILFLAALLVIFTLQNQQKVTLKLFFWTVSNIPVALLIILCMIIGYLIPTLLLIPRLWTLKSKFMRAQDEEDEEENTHESVRERQKPDPEGIPLDDEKDYSTRDLARKNLSGR